MKEWKEYKLGDIVEANTSLYSSKDKWEKALYLDTGNITENRIENIQEFDCQFLPSRAKRKVKHEDIIFSTVRPNQRHYGFITNPVHNLLVSTGFAVLSVKKEFANPKFVYYWLCRNEIIEHLQNIAEQSVSAYPSIKASNICDLEIELPSLKNQIKIACILSSLDDKIELNRRINENLEQQAQALFKSWFVDFEPFKDGKFVDSEFGMIPEGWKVLRADEVFNINIGKTPPRKESVWFSNYEDSNIKWVSISDMGNCGAFIGNSSEYLTEEAVNKFNIIIVPKKTVLLSFKLTVGRVAIAKEELTTNEAIARFYLPDFSYREFTYLTLKNYDYAKLGSTSSIATAVNSKIIKGMKILLPNDENIKMFNSITKPIFDLIESHSNEIDRLINLRDTLLPKLMSGELKINNLNI